MLLDYLSLGMRHCQPCFQTFVLSSFWLYSVCENRAKLEERLSCKWHHCIYTYLHTLRTVSRLGEYTTTFFFSSRALKIRMLSIPNCSTTSAHIGKRWRHHVTRPTSISTLYRSISGSELGTKRLLKCTTPYLTFKGACHISLPDVIALCYEGLTCLRRGCNLSFGEGT